MMAAAYMLIGAAAGVLACIIGWLVALLLSDMETDNDK
jgi:hypothetical protein